MACSGQQRAISRVMPRSGESAEAAKASKSIETQLQRLQVNIAASPSFLKCLNLHEDKDGNFESGCIISPQLGHPP